MRLPALALLASTALTAPAGADVVLLASGGTPRGPDDRWAKGRIDVSCIAASARCVRGEGAETSDD